MRTILAIWVCCLIRCYGIIDNKYCVGTWTAEWKKEVGDLPKDVLNRLNESDSMMLKQVFDDSECPFGVALPGDVTWPSPKRGLGDVIEPMDFLTLAMVAWSFSPYFVAAYLIMMFILHRGTRELWTITFIGFFVLLNEAFVKRILQQPRPGTHLEVKDYNGKFRGSCLKTCGMPSSHAGLTSGVFLLLFLDAAFRVRGETPATDRYRHPLQGILRDCRQSLRGLHTAPLSGQRVFSHFEFVQFCTFWFMVLVPSSISRIVLYDHSIRQVIVGMAVGFFSASLWWWLVRFLQYRYQKNVDAVMCNGLLTHNHPLQEKAVPEEGSHDDEWEDSDFSDDDADYLCCE